jgi:NitT/TauT family transport system substrate-binding protein
VKNYAATLPYNYEVLAANNARQLMTSYDVLGGPHTVAAIWASETWARENPKTYEATVAAFEEAVEMIAADREKAARTYAKWEGSKLPIPDVVRMIGNSADITFSATPSRSLVIAETMQKLGLIKTKPSAWTDYFHAGLHTRRGS